MLKNISRLEHKIGERVFHLYCDSDSPLQEVKDALFQFLTYVGNVELSMKAQQAQAAQQAPVEPPVSEENEVVELPKE